MDLNHRKHFQIGTTPDILILPSKLNHFCGQVKDSICLNPGALTKGVSGGTFATITVFPKEEESSETLVDRTMVEVKRI